MTWRLVGVGLGFLVYVLLVAAAIAGSPGALVLVVTVGVLVFLIGAGNLFQGWLGIKRRPPRFARPDLDAGAPPDDTGPSR